MTTTANHLHTAASCRSYDREGEPGGAGHTLLPHGEPVPFAETVDRPNPRRVSNLVCRERFSPPDPHGRSEFVWAWGQFLDHELDLIPDHPTSAPGFDIPVLPGPDEPRKEWVGDVIHFNPSRVDGVLTLENLHTAYIDASNVYGPSAERASALREGKGGRLRATAELELPPHNDGAQPIANFPVPGLAPEPVEDDRLRRAIARFRVAGDVRANEHCVLLALHTIFLREHNRIAERIGLAHPHLDDEDLFQAARCEVIAEMQIITYHEFLPALLGPGAISPDVGDAVDVDPSISNLFATACYRFGHSAVNGDLQLHRGSVELRDLFFVPELLENLGVEPLLFALASRRMRAVDTQIVDGLREHLFAEGNRQLLDLAALNIQRGRDHELPRFNDARAALGLKPIRDFDALTDNRDLAATLRALYGKIDEIDIWVAGLAETPRDGRRLGGLVHAVIVDQFERIRQADRFWFERDPGLTDVDRRRLRGRRLGDVIRDNVDESEMPVFGDVFSAA